jgi:hypothetical protein
MTLLPLRERDTPGPGSCESLGDRLTANSPWK